MRYYGVLASWNDDRGFGFIKSPTPGGKDVFVHISAFPSGSDRPEVGQRLSYELREEDGKPRAVWVQLPGTSRPSSPAPRPSAAPAASGPPRSSVGNLAAIGALIGLYFFIDLNWGGVPVVFPLLYAAASLVAFLAYAIDKSAAQRGGWRIQEKTLHLFALAGGWPGALLAQVLLRHKSRKTSFRLVFWLTVLVNLGLFAYLCSPYADPGLRQKLSL